LPVQRRLKKGFRLSCKRDRRILLNNGFGCQVSGVRFWLEDQALALESITKRKV
jgi:hypothetical protein